MSDNPFMRRLEETSRKFEAEMARFDPAFFRRARTPGARAHAFLADIAAGRRHPDGREGPRRDKKVPVYEVAFAAALGPVFCEEFYQISGKGWRVMLVDVHYSDASWQPAVGYIFATEAEAAEFIYDLRERAQR